MNRPVDCRQLFDSLAERLDLTWRAGRAGDRRKLYSGDPPEGRQALVGYLNIVHPNRVQILGPEEIAYLDRLASRRRWETLAEIFREKPLALIVSDGLSVPGDVVQQAGDSETPLLTTPRASRELLSRLQHTMGRMLAEQTTVHGVFMEVLSLGVLLTGSSGCGKSELALELLTRGHRLIADDSPEFTLVAPDLLEGVCPPILQDCLEVRGLGILNVRDMFGDSAVNPSRYLRLIIKLELPHEQTDEPLDRLHGEASTLDVLDVTVPVITLPVAPGRNLSVLVEVAVRNHLLKLKGYNPAEAFIERHNRELRGEHDP